MVALCCRGTLSQWCDAPFCGEKARVRLDVPCNMYSAGIRRTSSHHSSFMGIVCYLHSPPNVWEDSGSLPESYGLSCWTGWDYFVYWLGGWSLDGLGHHSFAVNFSVHFDCSAVESVRISLLLIKPSVLERIKVMISQTSALPHARFVSATALFYMGFCWAELFRCVLPFADSASLFI